MRNIYEVQSANKVKSFLVVFFFAAFVFLATYILVTALSTYWNYYLSGLGIVGVAFIISGITTFFSYWFSDKIILTISQARLADKSEDRLFRSVAENLCLGSGLSTPKLYVINDSAPNAFASGRNPKHSVICVTTGLLSKLNRTELEAVIGHELSHIKNYDTLLMSVVSVMVGLIALLADFFLRIGFRSGRNNDRDKFNSLIVILGIIFAIFSPLIAQLIQFSISRRREFSADAGSVFLTRQPRALIAALEKISADGEALEAANKATAHLYIINPFRKRKNRMVDKFASLFNTHPPLAERIKALESMV